jgi:membrane-associated phospholipid phosphatase
VKGGGVVAVGLLALAACATPARSVPDASSPFAAWHAATLDAVRAVDVAPPPAPGSVEERREVDEARTARRGLTAAMKARLTYWQAGTVLRWNELARGVVKRKRTDPVEASRVYALVSVAQHLALRTAAERQARVPERVHTYPSRDAAAATAAARVLGHLFPEDAPEFARLAAENGDACVWAGTNVRSDLVAGAAVGAAVAERVIARAQTDGAYGAVGYVKLPTGPGFWTPTARYMEPTLPGWGKVRPWVLARGDQLRPPPPPAWGSPEFTAALAEVRRISDTRTPEQLTIAKRWADGTGSPTPSGHWNAIAADLLVRHGVDEARAAEIFAVMNMAMMDAGIAVWDAKYTYFLIRPWQADPKIFYVVPRPNFPSYVSGHSGFSGAAAEVLGHFFPAERDELDRLAQEASNSRVYGGIHYRFDCDEGLKVGRAVARLALRAIAAE